MIKKILTFFFFSISLLIAKENVHPVVILGGGVGGLTSALYLARAGIRPCVIEGNMPGGLIMQSQGVENWPGERKISGFALIEKIRNQVSELGCDFYSQQVVSVDFSKRPFVIKTKELFGEKETFFLADSCIIAMGTAPNYLQVDGEKMYYGKGITHCAICDGSLYKDKTTVVVGGGEKAIEEALYLSNLSKKVLVVCRKDYFRFKDKKRYEELLKKDNVQILKNTTITKVLGDGEQITAVETQNVKTDEKSQIEIDGLFLAIGSTPNTQLLKEQLQLDPNGYILLQEGQRTSCSGVFAIGDITDPIYKQAITASADGAKAAMEVQKYLQSMPKQICEVIEIQSEEQFQKELQEENVLVCIDFYASWCGPCRMLSPYLDTFAQDLSGIVKILKVNVDKFPQISSSYQIRAMPTLVMVVPDQKPVKIVGGQSIKNAFENFYHKTYQEIISQL